MVEKIKFLIEGNNDIQFLKSFVKMNFAITLLDVNFHKIGGWAGLRNQNLQIQEFLEDDYQIILLLDTDKVQKQGGFEARKQFIENFKSTYHFDFDYYLLPNHQDDGALEDLIYDCIPDTATFKSCWQTYINCLSTNENYHTPANKSMIMSYNELLNGSVKFNADFENTAHFDFVNPHKAVLLKSFLAQFF
jgi:5S rRNA maturation endonuclease (ribonuclease M5)